MKPFKLFYIILILSLFGCGNQSITHTVRKNLNNVKGGWALRFVTAKIIHKEPLYQIYYLDKNGHWVPSTQKAIAFKLLVKDPDEFKKVNPHLMMGIRIKFVSKNEGNEESMDIIIFQANSFGRGGYIAPALISKKQYIVRLYNSEYLLCYLHENGKIIAKWLPTRYLRRILKKTYIYLINNPNKSNLRQWYVFIDRN